MSSSAARGYFLRAFLVAATVFAAGTVYQEIKPAGEQSGASWRTEKTSSRVFVEGSIRSGSTPAIVDLDVKGIGAPGGSFSIESDREMPRLEVIVLREKVLGVDTSLWKLRIRQAADGLQRHATNANAEVAEDGARKPADPNIQLQYFLWDPVLSWRLVAPAGMKSISVMHWKLYRGPVPADSDETQRMRTWMFWGLVAATGVVAIGGLNWLGSKSSTVSALDRKGYFEGVIAGIGGTDDTDARRKRAVARWRLQDNLPNSDVIAKIVRAFKTDHLSAQSLLFRALEDFEARHWELQDDVGLRIAPFNGTRLKAGARIEDPEGPPGDD